MYFVGDGFVMAVNQLLSVPLCVLILLTISIGETSGRLEQTPTDATAMVGYYPAYFNCSTSKRPVKKYAIWRYYPSGEGEANRKYIYDGGEMNAKFLDRMDIDINESSGTLNLVIWQPQLTDAGRYECSDDHDHTGPSAELMVLESNWVCRSNIDPKGLIGQTECDESISPDELNLTCSVTCIGKYFPVIKWRINGLFVTPFEPPMMKSGNRLTCYATMKASMQLEGSIEICQNGTQHCSHALNISKVLYAFGDMTTRECYTQHNVTCIANASRQLPCSYRWYKDDTTEVSSHSTFTPNDPGLYRCQAQCLIRANSCKFTAMVIKVSESGAKVYWPIVLVVVIVVIGSIIGLLVLRIIKGNQTWSQIRENHLFCFGRLRTLMSVGDSSQPKGMPADKNQSGSEALLNKTVSTSPTRKPGVRGTQ